jgi:hypothetical protein
MARRTGKPRDPAEERDWRRTMADHGADAGTQDLEADVDAVFQTQWLERDGRKVPEPEDVRRWHFARCTP